VYTISTNTVLIVIYNDLFRLQLGWFLGLMVI